MIIDPKDPNNPGTIVAVGGKKGTPTEVVTVQWEDQPGPVTYYGDRIPKFATYDAPHFQPGDRVRSKHNTAKTGRVSALFTRAGEPMLRIIPEDTPGPMREWCAANVELNPSPYTPGQRITHTNDTALVGTFVAPVLGGYSMVRWDGAAQDVRVPSANITHYTEDPAMAKSPRIQLTGELVPPIGSPIRHRQNHHHIGTLHGLDIAPGGAIATVRWTGATKNSTTPLADIEAMPKQPDVPAFTKGQRVRSLSPSPLQGVVAGDSDPDGTTMVEWLNADTPARHGTDTLELDPDADQPAPNVPPVGAELNAARGDAYLTVYVGPEPEDLATYHLPAVELREIPAKNGVQFRHKHFANDIHESVGADYCLDMAATWAAAAHRITQRKAAAEQADREQLEAEAQGLLRAYLLARDDLTTHESAGDAMSDFEIPEIRAGWLAVAKAARELRAGKGSL